jgi:hypothetical protein
MPPSPAVPFTALLAAFAADLTAKFAAPWNRTRHNGGPRERKGRLTQYCSRAENHSSGLTFQG